MFLWLESRHVILLVMTLRYAFFLGWLHHTGGWHTWYVIYHQPSVDWSDFTGVVQYIKWNQTRWTFFRVKLVFECDFEISWSLRPWDLGTLGPLSSSTTSSYFLLPPPTLLLWYGLVWGGGWVLTLEIEIDNWRWTFDLYIDVKKLSGGWWWWCTLDFSVSSGPFLSYEIKIGDEPGSELDN